MIDKIIFQVEHNRQPQRASYITNHLSHYYFIKDNFLKRFACYKALKKQIQIFTALPTTDNKPRNQWLRQNPAFLENLKMLSAELKANMVDRCLQSIISFLKCEHSLRKQKNGIDYFTKILVTQFYFTGRPHQQILDIFNRILNKQLKTFPFPPEAQSDTDKHLYLLEMNLGKQFMAMSHFFLERPVSQYLLLIVKGLRFEPKAIFRYNGIEFLHPRAPKLKHLFAILKNSRDKKSLRYYNSQDFTIAVAPVKVFVESDDFPGFTPAIRHAPGLSSILGFPIDFN